MDAALFHRGRSYVKTKPGRLLTAFTACLLAAGCVGQISDSSGPAETPDGSPITGQDGGPPVPTADAAPPGTPDAAPPGTPDATPPGPTPGANVDWLDFPPLHSQTGSGWGDVLTDIAQHLPADQVDYYWVGGDLVASGHEISHGIHAYVRNNYNNTGSQANGFYVLDDKAVIVKEPNIRKSDIIPYIPSSLRGMRYDLYVAGQTEWDDTPLYIWDEWNAYVNGTEVGVDVAQAGNWNGGQQDVCMGPLEFVVYSLAIGMAVEDNDPGYFDSYDQFREFLAWELDRAMRVFRTCQTLDDFGTWESIDTYYENLRTSADAAPFRAFITNTYGSAFAAQVLDL